MNALTFRTHINSDIIHLDKKNIFIGKDVIVSIMELPKKNKNSKKWNFIGEATITKNIDKINIRDFAYE